MGLQISPDSKSRTTNKSKYLVCLHAFTMDEKYGQAGMRSHTGRISKKFAMLAAVSAIIAGCAIYGANELAPPTITIVSGPAQYADHTFEEKFEGAGIVIEGQIKDVQTATFNEESTETDANGNEVVFETRIVPRAEITIKVIKTFKDNHGIDSDHVTVYDRDVENAIGQVNGERARFVSQDAIEYTINSRGIFFIENDRGLWIDGFTSFYEIKEGIDTIETEFDRKHGKDSIKLSDAREIAKLKAEGIREDHLDPAS